MKFSLTLGLLVLCLASTKAEHEIDILDVTCGSAIFNLTQKIMTQNANFTIEDTAILIFSGKRPFDLGSQEMCDLTPGMDFKIGGLAAMSGVYIGICIYDFCRAQFLNQAEQIAIPLLEQFIPDFAKYAQYQIQFFDEQDTKNMQDRQHTGFSLVTHLLYVLIAICFIGIAVEYSKCMDRPADHLEFDNVPLDPKKRKDKDIIKAKTKWGLFFLSFSFTRNIRKLTTVGSGGEGFDNKLEAFAGVRAMSMMYVILGHTCLVMMQGVNYANLGNQAAGSFGTFVQGAFYAVDAFFCMAGFLGTYVLLGKLAKSKGKINIPLAYFHRWYRLVPALALLILLFQYVMPFVVHGPVAFGFGQLLGACQKYWWSALIFINNLYPWKMNDQCVGWVWYLANDFQFFILTPFILLIMYHNKIIGFVVNVTIILLSIMASMVVTWEFNFIMPSADPGFSDQYYEKPWCRMASYMVGVLLAQLYYDRKLALKGDHRGKNTLGNCCFSMYKKYSLCSWGSALIGLALTTFNISIYSTAIDKTYGNWNLAESMAYNGLSRPLFVFGMMLVLMPTFEGRLNWLFSFMSNPLFVVLGRLTYCAYLMHFTVIYSYNFSLDSSNYFNHANIIYHYIGIYVLSYTVAFGMSLVIEAPLLTIEKTILFPPKPPKKKEEGQQKAELIEEEPNKKFRRPTKENIKELNQEPYHMKLGIRSQAAETNYSKSGTEGL